MEESAGLSLALSPHHQREWEVARAERETKCSASLQPAPLSLASPKWVQCRGVPSVVPLALQWWCLIRGLNQWRRDEGELCQVEVPPLASGVMAVPVFLLSQPGESTSMSLCLSNVLSGVLGVYVKAQWQGGDSVV